MEDEQLLRNLGFNKYEAVAYLTTLKEGIIDATELSKRSKIPMGKIYTVLENLESMGFIEVQHSRPKKYRAVETDIAFKSYYIRKENEINRELSTFRETIDDIQERLSNFSNQRERENNFWSAAMGTKEVMRLIKRAYQEAKSEICVVVPRRIKSIESEQFKDMFSSMFHDALLPLIQKRISIRIIDPNPVLSASLKQLHESIKDELILQNVAKYFEIRSIDTPHKFILIDGHLVILEINDPINSDKTFGMIKIYNKTMSKELHDKFEELWENSETCRSF